MSQLSGSPSPNNKVNMQVTSAIQFSIPGINYRHTQYIFIWSDRHEPTEQYNHLIKLNKPKHKPYIAAIWGIKCMAFAAMPRRDITTYLNSAKPEILVYKLSTQKLNDNVTRSWNTSQKIAGLQSPWVTFLTNHLLLRFSQSCYLKKTCKFSITNLGIAPSVVDDQGPDLVHHYITTYKLEQRNLW